METARPAVGLGATGPLGAAGAEWHAGGSLHAWFGHTFGRSHWKRDR